MRRPPALVGYTPIEIAACALSHACVRIHANIPICDCAYCVWGLTVWPWRATTVKNFGYGRGDLATAE